MSIPAQPQAGGLTHPTRQQLDELESLIQRMLALPVEPAGEPLAAAGDRASTALPPAAAEPSRSETAVWQTTNEATDTRPTAADPPPGGGEDNHATMMWSEAADRTADAVQAADGRSITSEAAASLSDVFSAIRLEASAAPMPESRGPGLAAAMSSPLVWMNAAFDGCTAWLGPAGGWLRSGRGRAVLGWTGLAFLSAALTWGVLEWTGWTW